MAGSVNIKRATTPSASSLLPLRMRADLRQAELAALLQVSQRPSTTGENGEAYPSEIHLRHHAALAQQRVSVHPGHEQEEAAHL